MPYILLILLGIIVLILFGLTCLGLIKKNETKNDQEYARITQGKKTP